MRIIKLFSIFLGASLFLASCNQTPQTATTPPAPYPNDAPLAEEDQDDYWAKDNLDLQRVGDVFERSESPQQFEEYLNEPDGINNLDLNGDGWVDYVSVREFDDRDTNQRGLSLFSSFGPGLVQEIAQLFLYRDQPNYPGARFLVRGNDQIYGQNQFYETNWLDRALPLATSLFSDHDPYRSPYYFDNYPSGYRTFEVVDTPYYRTRVGELYPRPTLAYVTAAPAYWEKIKIKSPNNGLHLGQIKARLANPTKDQADFYKNNPRKQFAKFGKDDKPGRDNPPRSDRGDERGNPLKDERGAERGNPGKPDVGKGGPPKVEKEHGGGNPNKGGNPDKGGGQGKGGGNDKGGGQGKGGGKKP